MEVLPVATVVFNLVQYLLVLAVFVPISVLFFRMPLSWSMLGFFPVLALQLLFTLGVSFLVSAATVFYRDVRHFTEILLTLLFWMTPIVYEVQAISESVRRVIYLNPLSFYTIAYQEVFYHRVFPSPKELLVLTALSLLMLAFGYSLFSHYRVRFAEEV